jgi:hypothetical protein
MEFSLAPPNPFYEHYSNRYESETGRWTTCLGSVLYGVRWYAGLTGDQVFALNVCCGNRQGDIALVSMFMNIWLSKFDESADPDFVRSYFPEFTRKPVVLAPEWEDFMLSVISFDPPLR